MPTVEEAHEQTLKYLYEDLNFPSAQRLRAAALKEGLPLSHEEAREFVRRQSTAQIFAPAPVSTGGKVTAGGINQRFVADLVDMSSHPGGRRYILVVQDIFSRKIWARALVRKSADVVANRLEDIFHDSGAPAELNTDRGLEFTGAPTRALLVKKGIHHRYKVGPNDLATADRAIQELKRGLYKAMQHHKENWPSLLEGVVKAHNRLNSEALMGAAPNDVHHKPGTEPANAALEFFLKKRAGEDMAANAENAAKRHEKLQEAGAFRVRQDWAGKFRRGFKPRWSDEVHQVAKIEGGKVTDENGRSYPVKLVLPVPRGSAHTETASILRSGRAAHLEH